MMKILLCGVGGQGVLLASKIIGSAALVKGINVVMSEVHGMAQRGGVVTSNIILGEELSPLIGDGDADVILGFEPAETLRFLNKASKDTYVVTNTRQIIPFTTTLGIGTYPDVVPALEGLKGKCKKIVTLDAREIAERAGAKIVSNIVMLGALSTVPEFPLSKQEIMEQVRQSVPPKFVDINLKAFEMGYNVVAEG